MSGVGGTLTPALSQREREKEEEGEGGACAGKGVAVAGGGGVEDYVFCWAAVAELLWLGCGARCPT